ncbi:acetyltransferase [Candidatus Methanophagaceae archaeon]|nr:acetyltransferase [Methanophagales archaeon]
MYRIENMLNPKSVALIGATDREGTIGRQLTKNLLLGKDMRKVYAVNPNRETVLGLKCFPSITEVPEHIDLAVIATPAKTVPEIVNECGQSGVDGAVIISAGFREIGEEGERLEDEINQFQEKHGLRILGPNCLGFVRPHAGLNATFLRNNPKPGEIAFISQSGALGTAILDWAVSTHVGFSMFASLGSMLNIDFGDLIDYLGRDPYTRSIVIYMEGVGSARKFISATKGFARTKPIIVLKPGKYLESAKAARSHTGALAGNYEVYAAAFKRGGAVHVDEIENLFNCASVLDSRYLPAGPRLAIISNGGGPGVMATDSVIDNGGEIVELSDELKMTLGKFLPPYWSNGNPIDLLGDADVERYDKTIRACIHDPEVDGIIVIYTPQGTAQPRDLAKKVIKIAEKKLIPILTVWMGEKEVEGARKLFYAHNIPRFQLQKKLLELICTCISISETLSFYTKPRKNYP